MDPTSVSKLIAIATKSEVCVTRLHDNVRGIQCLLHFFLTTSGIIARTLGGTIVTHLLWILPAKFSQYSGGESTHTVVEVAEDFDVIKSANLVEGTKLLALFPDDMLQRISFYFFAPGIVLSCDCSSSFLYNAFDIDDSLLRSEEADEAPNTNASTIGMD
eukprot:scaffold2259_cov180-Amphora_coffeaeformis.AAC.6